MTFEEVTITDKLLQEDEALEIYQSQPYSCQCIVLLCIFLFVMTMGLWFLFIVYSNKLS